MLKKKKTTTVASFFVCATSTVLTTDGEHVRIKRGTSREISFVNYFGPLVGIIIMTFYHLKFVR